MAGIAAWPTLANADFIATIDGNDCAGVFGQGFENCKVPEIYDTNQSPVIIKFDYDDNGDLSDTSINSGLFPTITGTEFSIIFGAGGSGIGTWTYTPGAGDPAIHFFVAKGGPLGFNLFSNLGDANSDSYYTPDTPAGKPAGLSHITFYDSGGPLNQVPEPAPLALLGVGALALLTSYRRRNAA
ncbi:MAG: PEP-CTERM sorting domain-containing protein [Casimicrobiaceae bacterium]